MQRRTAILSLSTFLGILCLVAIASAQTRLPAGAPAGQETYPGLTAVAASPSQIDLIWQDNAPGETAYHVERSPDGSTGWTEIDTVAAVLASIEGLYCRVLSETGIHDCGLDPVYSTLDELPGAASYYLRLDSGTEAGLQVQGHSTPGDPLYSPLAHMESGQGYMIHTTQATSPVYPTGAGLAQSTGTGQDLVACSDLSPTPAFTLVYGKLVAGGDPAPLGTVVEVLTPRGEVAGCFVLRHEGLYGFMRVYGEDPVDPPIPGFRDGEPLAFRANGVTATSAARVTWTNDLTPHEVDLAVPDVRFAIYLPILLHN